MFDFTILKQIESTKFDERQTITPVCHHIKRENKLDKLPTYEKISYCRRPRNR